MRTTAPRLNWNDALLSPMLSPTGEKVMRRSGPVSTTWLAAGPGACQNSAAP